jgi:flagellar hook-associated protein 1 FlgK
MSLTATLANALSGLTVAQRALSVTANNVANANTEGYVRKVLTQEAVFIGSRGAGVQASEISRMTDQFLTAEVRRQASVVGRSEILGRYQDLLQDAFGAPGDSRDLAAMVSELGVAIEAFANQPESATLALQVIQTANGLGATIGQLAEHVQVLRAQADEDIGRTVAEINAELQALDELNVEIERLAHLGQVGPELLDRRDALIRSLAEKIDLRTFVQEDNRIALYTAGGETLLDVLPRVVAYNPAATVMQGTSFGRIAIFREDQIDPTTGQPIDPTAGIQLVSSGVRASLTPELQNDATPDTSQLITSRLRGGRLQGLLEARDLLLPELDDQIQELADNLRFVVNAAHNDGSPWPPPAQLTGTRTDLSAFAAAARSGFATIAVIDRADGCSLAAFQIDMAAAADPAALAGQINAGLGAFGSAAIGPNGNLEITLSDPDQGLALAEGDSRITITDAAGRDRDYGFAHYFGLNDLFVLSGNRPSTLAVRPDLASDPARLSRARLDVQTGPLLATLGGRGDNRAAQALAGAFAAQHDVLARGGLPARPVTLAAYAGDLVAHAAMRAQHAAGVAQRDRALADALEFRAAAVSGVNLDEELARMVQLQQAYSVAARIISVTDELFDELLGTVS